MAPAPAVESKQAVVTTPTPPSRDADAAPLAAEPERATSRGTRPVVVDAAPPAGEAAPSPARPSQSDFAPPEPPARAPQVGSTLADETRILDAAFAALARGDRAQAGALIGEHEARYPAGLLQKERERAKARLSELSRGE